MSPELEEFRQRLLAHAKLVVARSAKVESEVSTNASLVQPFLIVLGYDVSNPDEVYPEHHADFSEKYQNKVDYAIMHQGVPVVALESKCVGAAMKDDRGQLRSYFNACPTVKLGILTDGLKYEFYADSDKPNMMDEAAFLRVDLTDVAKDNAIDDNTLGGIATIRNGSFNPENVGAEAKQKLLFESLVDLLKRFKTEPSDEFIRFILGSSTVGGKITKITHKIVEANREIVRSAMEAFVAQEALSRFGYAPKDVVRAPQERTEPAPVVASAAASEPEAEGLLPSEAEMSALTYTRNRLFYLVRNEVLFQEIHKITYRKSKASFRIYYGRPNNGSIFDYRESREGKISTQFPALDSKEIVFAPSVALDEALLKVFTQRVTEAGISLRLSAGASLNKGGSPAATSAAISKAAQGSSGMKIDHDYLKKLLEACQTSKKPTFDIKDLRAAGFDYNAAEFEFHMAILDDQGFIQQDDGDPGFGLTKSIDGFLSWSVLPLRLTASGHDFLDTVQNPEVWSKTKAAAKKVGGVGFDLFLQIAKAEAKRFAFEKLGLVL